MMQTFLSFPVMLAVAGAIPTAIRGLVKRKRDLPGGLSDALIGIVLAASVADWLTPEDSPAVALLVGLVAGMVGAPAIDAAHELTPRFVRELVLGWARKYVARADGNYEDDDSPTVIDGENEHE